MLRRSLSLFLFTPSPTKATERYREVKKGLFQMEAGKEDMVWIRSSHCLGEGGEASEKEALNQEREEEWQRWGCRGLGTRSLSDLASSLLPFGAMQMSCLGGKCCNQSSEVCSFKNPLRINSRFWNSWVYVYGLGSSGSLDGRVGAELAQAMSKVKLTVHTNGEPQGKSNSLYSVPSGCGWEPSLCLRQSKKLVDLGLR